MVKKIVMLLCMVGLMFAAQAKQIDKSFVLKTIDGKKIHITVKNSGIEVKEYPGKVIILDFFGKNCPPCRMEMPILGDLQKRLADKMQIIGLHVQKPLRPQDVLMLKKRGINYPVVDYITNKQNEEFVEFMGRLTGWSGNIPFMLFFDRSGKYAGYHIGMADEKSLERFILKLSNPPKPASKEQNATKK